MGFMSQTEVTMTTCGHLKTETRGKMAAADLLRVHVRVHVLQTLRPHTHTAGL